MKPRYIAGNTEKKKTTELGVFNNQLEFLSNFLLQTIECRETCAKRKLPRYREWQTVLACLLIFSFPIIGPWAEILAICTAAEHLLESGKQMENIAIFTDSLSTLQALNSADPDQINDPGLALLPCQADSSVFSIPPVGACSCGTDRKRKCRQTLQKSAVRLRRHRTLSPTERSRHFSTPDSMETGRKKTVDSLTQLVDWSGPSRTLPYLLPAHRALWYGFPSEEDCHLRHFPVWVRTCWPDPRPRPSVLPKICRETSANMAAWCWSGDQAVGLGRRPLPYGWFCGTNRTEDLTCTAADCWRRRRRRRSDHGVLASKGGLK